MAVAAERKPVPQGEAGTRADEASASGALSDHPADPDPNVEQAAPAQPKPEKPAEANVKAAQPAEAKSKPDKPVEAKVKPAPPAEAKPKEKPVEAKPKPKPAEPNAEQAAAAKPKPEPPATLEGAPSPAKPAAEPALTAPVTQSGKVVARQLRRDRSRRLAFRFALFVVLPTVAVAVYFALVATDQYESHSVFTVQSAEMRANTGLEGLIGGIAGGGSTRDALAVRDYVLSRDMLARLDKEHGFIRHYKQPSIDWLSRLSGDSSFEDAFEYYGSKIYADFDTMSGAVTLRVRAFDAGKAREFAQAVLAYSEEMVNKLSERERRDRTGYAEAEVKKSEQRLVKARESLVALQQKHGDFNPLQTATAAMTIRTGLEAELAKARAEVMQLKSYMNDDAPQVRAANERVRSLSAQVAQESQRLVNPKTEGGLNTSMSDFEAQFVEKEFAQKAYESSLAQLEIARADAARQHRYLATIATPSLPDESTYPRRIAGTATAFLLSFLLLGIGSLIIAAVREHSRL